jgi:hypothetical protein
LSDAELERLSQMLLSIRAAISLPDAQRMVAQIPSKNSEDILCSLWYLVPETKMQIEGSLRDEYSTLGGAADRITDFAQSINKQNETARRAYELVAVASKLNIGLSIEVLVRALEINYDEWLEWAGAGKPVWGLLYDDQDDSQETIFFRTRNEVVTRVLIGLLNGGVGHAGEFSALKALISACDSDYEIFRDFLISILVSNRKTLSSFLNFEQGLELYSITESKLPSPDRLLAMHKGIWMQDHGHSKSDAYAQFETALQTEEHPASSRPAPESHVHTSMAATVVQMIRNGEQDPETGFTLVEDHLRQVSRTSFFDPYASHVSASLYFQLATAVGSGYDNERSIKAIGEALDKIEHALQSIGSYNRNKKSRQLRDIEHLTELRGKILAAVPIEQLKEFAHALFEQKCSQAGLEAYLRIRLTDATQRDRGKDYNKFFGELLSFERIVEEKDIPLSPEMHAIYADLIIRWRIQRIREPIDWERFQLSLNIATNSPKHQLDVIKRFYHAVAFFHLERIPEATAIFSQLNRLPGSMEKRQIRAIYIGDQGKAKQIQCTISNSHGQWYADIPELGTDVQMFRRPRAAGSGVQTHVYVGFTLRGPVAFPDAFDETELLLP